MKKAFAYYRKSIEKESDKSIAGQQEVVQQYAKENDIEIVKEFEEVASSATVERDELNKMFQMLKENDIDYILLHRFDRITREVIHMGHIMTLLQINSGKTRLHSVTESNDYENDPTKIMMIMMQTYGATIERNAIVARMQEARKRKKKKGGYIGGTQPFGYATLRGTGNLTIHPGEAYIVIEIFRMREKGFKISQIAKELNARGYSTRRNKDFHINTISRILKYEDMYRGKGLEPAILIEE